MDEVTNVLARLTVQLEPWWDVLLLGSYLMGLVVFGVSLLGLPSAVTELTQQRGAGKGGGMGKPLLGMVSGAFLLNIGALLDVVSMSVFASQSVSALSYAPPGSGVGATYLKFSIYIIMLIGLGAVIKGGYMLRNSMENHEEFWKSILYIGCGTLCVNFITFMRMLGYSAGGGFNTTIRALLG